MRVLALGLVVIAGLLTGGAIGLRRQGRPLSVALVPATMAAALLGLAVLLGAFG